MGLLTLLPELLGVQRAVQYHFVDRFLRWAGGVSLQ